ncbi:hypothetical protein HDU97_007586 [Phlyctochytrium planicorne]|nr:hypothetical protein HDU97_007586 [Phlyctochytrium planicorne]
MFDSIYNPARKVEEFNADYHRVMEQKADLFQRLASAGASENAADFFENCVDEHGDLLAVKAVDNPTKYTYSELDIAANRIAWWASSSSVGVKAGDTVCLLMENRPEFLAFTMGLAKIGATSALLNTNLSGVLLAHAILSSAAKVIVTSVAKFPNLKSAIPHLDSAKNDLSVWLYQGEGKNVNMESPETPAFKNCHFLNADVLGGQSIVRPNKSVRSSITPRSPLFYIFTSGTTGPSKAAKFSHKRFIGAAITWAGPSRLSKGDHYYITLPLYHGNAGVVAVAPCYLLGNPIVLREKFSVSNFFKDIRENNCKATIYIGELWRYLLTQPNSPLDGTKEFSPLRVIIGNGLRSEIWTTIKERFALDQIVEHYGSTEMPGDAVLNYFNCPGSCGFLPLDVARAKCESGEGGTLVRYNVETDAVVRDEVTGFCERCDADEVGEMIMRLPDGLYDGYVGEAATRRKLYENVFQKGDKWWSSGDLLKTDSRGFFFFVDRTGDSFRWKGENVSTNEVIAVISEFPSILECNVYGVKIPNTDGRAGMASIVLPEDAPQEFPFAEFTQYVSKRLPNYARPLFVRIRTKEHEKTSTIKFQKFKYVQQGYNPLECEGDRIWFWDASSASWTLVTTQVKEDIDRNKYKL